MACFMSLETLDTVDQVMAALGGNQAVASLTASKPSTLSMWRKAKSFPSNTHYVMTKALGRIGKTAPATLWGMKTEPVLAPPISPCDDPSCADDETEVRRS